jgi:arylsulfatase A-like enzyme
MIFLFLYYAQHEESIRVPLIVLDPRMPAGKAGTVRNEFTLNVDLAPTLLRVGIKWLCCSILGYVPLHLLLTIYISFLVQSI